MHEWFETLGLTVREFSQYCPYTKWPRSVLTHQTCTGILMVRTERQRTAQSTTNLILEREYRVMAQSIFLSL